jgi:ATP-dependent helicase/nuclease subunit A
MPADGERLIRSGLTDEQHRAVTARGTSVALSAGAGCGKTFVLTERFLAELDPDNPSGKSRLNQLVAITFTERAAREMRDRIRAACRRRLLECPDHQANYWLALVRDLDAARISTIHSFCGSLLRAHAVEAGVDPRFRVLDGAQAGTLLFELTDEVLRDRLAERNEAALALVTRFGLDRLRGMVARLLAMREQIDWPVWRRETPEGLVARWTEFWRCDTLPRVLRRIGESAAAKTLLDVSLRYPPAPPKMRERCDFLIEHLPKLPDSERPAEAMAALREAAKVQGGATKNTWGNATAFEQFRDAAKELREAIDDVADQMRFDAAAARPAAEIALQLIGLTADLAEQYNQKKQELGVLDFNDLLIHARDLLTGPERSGLRKHLASQIRLLLVDEFQDTDPLQVEMLKSLCNNEHLRGKLFFVGDFKQSIYRFRGAQPHVFRQLREEIPLAGRLPLSLNFRSQPAILDFVNALFSGELGPDYEPLRPQRPQIGPTPAVEFLWANEAERAEEEVVSGQWSVASQSDPPSDDMGRRERLRRREADWIARRIRAMLDAGETIVWDEKAAKNGPPALRAVRCGDIALLFRALTNVEYYEEALRRYGIDYYLVGGHAFYAQQEIYDLLNLLRAINSPCDEVSLAGVLRSPMFGLLDETLFWLSHSGSLSKGLFGNKLPKEIEDRQRQQAEYAAVTLRTLRASKDRLPLPQLIQEALERTGYDALLVAEFLGERKLANLHKLIEQARSFDRAGIFSLADFITQLSEFVARQPDEALAATHPESADVVRLMSIHQSKGLEFPVVVVPDVGRPRLVRGPAVAFTPELGPMFKDTEATTGYDLWMMAENEEDLSETGRLLYVAATRAADYLILSAGVEEPGKATGPWMDLIGRRFELESGEWRVESGEETTNLPSPVGRGIASEGRSEDQSQHTFTLSQRESEPRILTSHLSPLVKVTLTQPPIQSKPIDLRQRRDLMKILEKARQMADEGQGRMPQYMATISPDPTARRQYSFSRLTGKLHTQQTGADFSPLDADSSVILPAEARGLGTLVHAVLAEIDFARPGDIAELVRRHADEQLLGSEYRSEELTEMVGRFLASPRAAAIVAAGKVYRELEFLLAWPPNGPASKGRCFQGFIDCLYCDEAGQWRVIDYKTNRGVTADTIASAAVPYELQMLVYALATEQILHKPPAELVLYFLRPGLEYRIPWNDAARNRVIEMVDRALQQP